MNALAAIISAMHRPVDGVVPAFLQQSNREKITQTPQRRGKPHHSPGQIDNNGQANCRNQPQKVKP